MTDLETVMLAMLGQAGDTYVFGAEADPLDADPDEFDCSELIEWACARAGVTPRMPDGSWWQYRHCVNHKLVLPIDQAIRRRGALLFRFKGGDPLRGQRPSQAHVAVALGDGTTIEARGRRYGVGTWAATGRGWTHAGLMPGVQYSPATPVLPRGKIIDVLEVRGANLGRDGRLPVRKFTADGHVLCANGAEHLGDLAGIALNSPITHVFHYQNGYGMFAAGDDGTFLFPG